MELFNLRWCRRNVRSEFQAGTADQTISTYFKIARYDLAHGLVVMELW